MLRSRLYLGMLPVVGLLIAVCLYSIHSYRRLNDQLGRNQARHYAAISEITRVLFDSSQIERALLLRKADELETANRLYQANRRSLESWLARQPKVSPEQDIEEFPQLVQNLLNTAKARFESKQKLPAGALDILGDRIESTALREIAKHNDRISEISQALQAQSRTHFAVVLSGIVASVLLMGIVAYFLSQRILKPIDALTLSASRLADNDWKTNYTPSSRDEISKLEIAFVEMAERIQRFQQLTSREIVKTRRRMEECFNKLPHPALFIDAKWELIYANPAAAELIAALGSPGSLPPQLISLVNSVFGDRERTQPTDFDETISYPIDNRTEHFLPFLIRIKSEEAEENEYALILQNVTNLRLSDELKSDLVATVSHEIRTPVTSATMALHLVLEKSLGALNADQEDMIRTATSDLDRLKRLLDHLLQIARIESKSHRLELAATEPGQIARDAIEVHALAAKGKAVQLSAAIEPDLPLVEVDRKALEVALSNYLSNAIKYSPAQTKIEIYARREGQRKIRFGVKDQGPGLPAEDVDRVFEKFFRSENQRSSEGIGLGLSIVKEIALAHGGAVGCESPSEGGADFYIDIAG